MEILRGMSTKVYMLNYQDAWLPLSAVSRPKLATLSLALVVGAALLPLDTSMAENPGAKIVGHVAYTGHLPRPEKVTVREDREFCGPSMSIQTIRMQPGGKGLQQSVVSLERMETALADSPKVGQLQNDHCAFRERIQALRKGDSLEVHNLDPILHNAHGTFGKRTILNVAQVPGGRSFKKRLKYTGHFAIKCDKHEFMQAHVMVFAHPYFAITDEAGHFGIESVPPGPHRIVVWHETLGKLEKDIVVPLEGTLTVDFEYHE